MNLDRQLGLFDPSPEPAAKPPRIRRRLKVLITVKAAPNPSVSYGETVCVAGVSIDPDHPGWIRLYPINFRNLEGDVQFKKYDIIEVDATPAASDPRSESWRPDMTSLRVVGHLPPWPRRRPLVEPYLESSMCAVYAVSKLPEARSLAVVRAAAVTGFDVERHPGWSPGERAKIDAYVGQLDLFGTKDRSALEAPRLKGWYKWRCRDPGCDGHRHGLLDWEFVALQRRLPHMSDADLAAAVRQRFLKEICGPGKDLAFFVGNQAKRHHVFSVLGVWYPPAR